MHYVFGKRVKHRLKQGFVAEYNGGFLLFYGKVFTKPLWQVTCLSVFGRRFYKSDVFGMIQVVEYRRRKFRRKVTQITADKLACLMGGTCHIENIVLSIK